MNKKLTPHIIAVNALVVFIVLGLACASTPASEKGPKPMPLSQAVMSLDDPRMPPDKFGNEKDNHSSIDGIREAYWLGTLAPEDSLDKQGFLKFESFVSDLIIDGKNVKTSRYDSILGLTPGKHTLRFSYHERRDVYVGGNTMYLNLDYANVTLDVNVESGKYYNFSCRTSSNLDELDRRSLAVSGYTNNGYSVSFGGSTLKKPVFDKPPSLKAGRILPVWIGNYKSEEEITLIYLEPYDSNIPVKSQSFLEMRDGMYIVGFDGNRVSWGGRIFSHVTIGIPAGRHELQLVQLGKKTLYTTIIDTRPQQRYCIRLSGKEVLVSEYANSINFVVTESGKFTP